MKLHSSRQNKQTQKCDSLRHERIISNIKDKKVSFSHAFFFNFKQTVGTRNPEPLKSEKNVLHCFPRTEKRRCGVMTDDSRAKFCILVNEIKFRETAFYTARDLTCHPWEREPRALTLTDLTLPLMLNNCTYLDGYPKFQNTTTVFC